MENKDLSKLNKIMQEISELDYNWNGYEAEPISNDLIQKSVKVISKLPKLPFIAPTGRNTIQVEFDLKDGSYLEFEMYANQISVLFVPAIRQYNKAKTYILNWSQTDYIVDMANKFLNGQAPICENQGKTVSL